MKKKKYIFIIIFLCISLSLTVTMHADSGWDGSYDSGGSSSWGGSYDSGGSSWNNSSSWNGGSSSSSGSHNHKTGTFISPNDSKILKKTLKVLFIIFVIMIIRVIIKNTKDSKIKKKDVHISLDEIFYKVNYNENNIKEYLPDFDINLFRIETYKIYRNIQIAWMNFDYDTLQKYTTNELYNLYKSQLIALSAKKQQNIMEDFELLDFSLFNIEKGKNDISIKIRMKISCKDYVIDSNKKVVRGDKEKVIYDYEMTFTKGLVTKDNKCPNCNAPLENNITTTCAYCDSVIINANYDWVLSKKQVINQYRK